MTKMNTEEAFVKVLQMHGIENAFGIIGSAMMPVSDLFPQAGIKFWDVAHECNGGMMAIIPPLHSCATSQNFIPACGNKSDTGIIAEPIMPNAFSIPCIWRTLTKASSVFIFVIFFNLVFFCLIIKNNGY